MIIYLLETRRGSPDAHIIKRYHEGKHYSVPDAIGRLFVNKGWAIEIPEEDIEGITVCP
jgi:hypothetical protein